MQYKTTPNYSSIVYKLFSYGWGWTFKRAYNHEAGTTDDLSGTREQNGFGWIKQEKHNRNPTLTDHPDLTLSIFPSLHSDRQSDSK